MFKKENFILLIILFFVSSCGDTWDSVKRGLTNQKQKSTDEFLIQKKDPLILPPNYDVLPTPRDRAIAQKEQSEFEKMILNEANIVIEDESAAGSSTESNILEKIKKN